MKFFAVAALIATAMALPATELEGRTDSRYSPCKNSGLLGSSRCCAVNVLGLVSLDCKTPNKVPSSANNFRDVCKNQSGRAPQCCLLGLAGQALLCEDPAGIHN